MRTSRIKLLVFPVLILISLFSCGKNEAPSRKQRGIKPPEIKTKDIREQMKEKYGLPDKVKVYFRGGDDLCLQEYWEYERSAVGYMYIYFQNCGFGFYLIDENYQPISEIPNSGNSKDTFSKNPKVMRAVLMQIYSNPITIKWKHEYISIGPEEYWIYEDENKVLIIQDTTFFYKKEYGEGYSTTIRDEQK